MTPAPCKLNLTLDVGAPRPDGFHEIDSLVVRLSPADEVSVTLRPGARGVKLLLKDKRPDAVAAPPLPRGPENLAFAAAARALDALAPELDATAWVTLVKNLPAQAGLGAGSSDAAATLRALAALLDAPTEALLPLAAALGSDVSLFLSEAPLIRVQSRGEVCSPAPISLPTLWGVLVRPAIGVATGPAYALLDAHDRRVPGAATAGLLAAAPQSAEALAPLLSNDFEAPVLAAYPEIAGAHRAVADAGALRALLCGSGSAIFGLARDRAHALEITKALAGKVAWLKLASTL